MFFIFHLPTILDLLALYYRRRRKVRFVVWLLVAGGLCPSNPLDFLFRHLAQSVVLGRLYRGIVEGGGYACR